MMAQNPELVYDYIVCGGGTAGCVVAGRLAEDQDFSVLLIEAGAPQEQVPASNIPAAVSQILGTEADWRIYNKSDPKLDGREIHLGRGKFLGGSSGCNGTLCIRGVEQDYDDWQMDGWSGAEMFRNMSKAETFKNEPWFKANNEAHGNDGPVLTAPHDPAEISTRVLRSYESSGLPLNPDMFTTGTTSHGSGHAIRTIYRGTRSAATAFISGNRLGKNLNVKTNYYVDKLVFEEQNVEPRVVAVEIQGPGGERTVVRARKEVVLSTGAYGTPAVLLRSGIGPATELAKHNITPILELPGVGRNLIDHLVMLCFYEVYGVGITNDAKIWHTGGKEASMAEYKASKTGFFSQFPFGTFAYARLDERLRDSPLWQNASRKDGRDPMGLTSKQPHVEFWNTECYSPKYLYRDFPKDDKHAFALATEFFSPRSRGTVTLKSTDPTVNPEVDHNYLSDPLDMLVFTEACRLANEIVLQGEGTKDIIKGSWPETLTHHTYTTREEWESAIRARADTCYHAAGTCKMGTGSDPYAVLDAKLNVRGVKGLRVADASVMPSLMCGHPQMAVYGIGEKAADLIKADA